MSKDSTTSSALPSSVLLFDTPHTVVKVSDYTVTRQGRHIAIEATKEKASEYLLSYDGFYVMDLEGRLAYTTNKEAARLFTYQEVLDLE